MTDKQVLAKILYTREHLPQNVIAKKLGVSANTVCDWVKKFSWDSLRQRLLVGKEEVLHNLYEQISELNESIRNKQSGKRYGDTKEADILIKYTASIRNLETKLAIADLVESGIRFIKHLQKVGTQDQVMEFSELWHSFLQASMKK
jgi:transposase